MESEYRAVFFQYVVRVAAGGGSGGGGGDDHGSSSDRGGNNDAAALASVERRRTGGGGGGAGDAELLLVSGHVELICVDPATGSPTKFPAALVRSLAPPPS